MQKLFVLSALLLGTASVAAHAAPSFTALQGKVGSTSVIQQAREASEGPRREDRRSDRRNDRRGASAAEPGTLSNGIILVREASEGPRREDRRADRRNP